MNNMPIEYPQEYKNSNLVTSESHSYDDQMQTSTSHHNRQTVVQISRGFPNEMSLYYSYRCENN